MGVNKELLEEYIKKSGLKIDYICEQLGISRQAFGAKRNNLIKFRAAEVFVLCVLLKINEEDKRKIFLPDELQEI